MGEVVITKAVQKDLPAIQELLAKSKLPPDDVHEHLENFFVAKQGEKIAGTAGLEL